MTGTLVQQGMLVPSGHGRGMRYCLPGKKMPDLFSVMDVNSEHYERSSEHYHQKLKELAAPVRDKGKANRELVKNTILQICSEHYLELRALSTLLNRSPETIRTHYVNSHGRAKIVRATLPGTAQPPQTSL